MTTKKFSNALGNIGESYIDEAVSYTAKKKSNAWLKWSSIAACFCLIMVGIISIYPNFLPERPASMNLFGTPWVVADNSICIQRASYVEEIQTTDGNVLTPDEGFTFVAVECDLVLDKSTSIAECYIQKSEVDAAQYDILSGPIIVNENSTLLIFSVPEKESATTPIDRFCLTITLSAGEKTYSCDFSFSK